MLCLCPEPSIASHGMHLFPTAAVTNDPKVSLLLLCPTLCDPMDCATPGFPVLHYLPEFKLMSVESVVMLSNHLILCRMPPSPPPFNPSQHQDFFSPSKSALRLRWPKYWSFSFSTCPSSRYSGLICFRIDWFDLLVVKGTLKSLL